jgi:hypothetical protein
MKTFWIIAGFGSFGLALLVAVANWTGVIALSRRKKEGVSDGYSCVPLVSLICCFVAWSLIKDQIGLWSFAPAAVDLGTLSFVVLPIYLLVDAIRKR